MYEQGSAKQEFKQETNQPTVTFKVKDKNKFKKVTEEISKKRDNVVVVWLHTKKVTAIKKKHKTLNLFLQQVLMNQSILIA